jgi:HSP20 family protein
VVRVDTNNDLRRAAMLMRTDPFRELDRVAQQVFGTWSRPTAMPMDAYRDGEEFVAVFDLPGVTADAIELNVERNVLTVKAERRPAEHHGETLITERPLGVYSRQLFLGDTLDTDRIVADYADGVLTLRIPVLEKAKPRRIEISTTGEPKQINT